MTKTRWTFEVPGQWPHQLPWTEKSDLNIVLPLNARLVKTEITEE